MVSCAPRCHNHIGILHRACHHAFLLAYAAPGAKTLEHRQAFLDAIIADPDDDMVRLVYADWLEESGTAADLDRARFIRLQIELEGVDADDRRRVISEECNQLIDRHWRKWTHGFQPQSTDAAYYKNVYKRGFLPYMCLDDRDLNDPTLDTLLAHEPITNFFMRRIDTFPESIAHWKHLPRVRDLSSNGGGKNAKDLLRSPLLTGLHAVEGGVLDEEDAALIASDPRFAGLRRLKIYGGLTDRTVELIAQSRNLSRLASFDYSGDLTTIAALEAVAASPLASRLTFIAPRHTTRLGTRAAELLAGFQRLQGIDLRYQEIGDEGAEQLASSAKLADLKLLDLGHNGLGRRGVTALLTSPYLTQVEELDLTKNPPGGDWITAFASAGPRQFRQLTLEDNQLDTQAAVLLANSVALQGVRELSLRGNPIGDQGAIALARSPRLVRLHKLTLGRCDIGDEGAIALAESATLGRLAGYGSLGLSHNRYGKQTGRRLTKRFGYNPASC